MITHKIGDQVETNEQALEFRGINAVIVGYAGSGVYVLKAKLSAAQQALLLTSEEHLVFNCSEGAFSDVSIRAANLGEIVF